jgi:hypothetical protein
MQRGQEKAMLITADKTASLHYDPLTNKVYSWSTSHLVPVSDASPAEQVRALLGEIYSRIDDAEGLGVGPYARDPWGVKTTNMPLAMRMEIEEEEEFKKIHRAYAPYADEYAHHFGAMACSVYRVWNLVSGHPKHPHYACPYVDKSGKVQLALGTRHPHLAIEQLQSLAKNGQVDHTVTNFNERDFGYDMKTYLSSQDI